jgi:phage shock protein A
MMSDFYKLRMTLSDMRTSLARLRQQGRKVKAEAEAMGKACEQQPRVLEVVRRLENLLDRDHASEQLDQQIQLVGHRLEEARLAESLTRRLKQD